ncbi:MAG: DUF1836 domain-containing protein [Oscillospiraceae bacterium]|nr:DUF1836 domain-containing protein [Oscillospiraceae bacterium]
MDENTKDTLGQLIAQLEGQKLPRWSELPDFELYMDQLIALMERYFRGYPLVDPKGLTSSMVNNYVKLGYMPAPVKRKYSRIHLAYLIIICTLKPVLPMNSIKLIMEAELESQGSYEELYDRFCGYFEKTVAATSGDAYAHYAENSDVVTAIFRSALRAQAEQAVAAKILESVPVPEKDKKHK